MSRYRGRLELLLQELLAMPLGVRPEEELAQQVLAALAERYGDSGWGGRRRAGGEQKRQRSHRE